MKNELPAARAFSWIETLVGDGRQAVRRLIKSPGFTAVAVLTLALGIGATTALFSVVNGVLLRPLDYSEPERILTLWSMDVQHGNRYPVSGPDFRDWQHQSHSFGSMAKYYGENTGVVVGPQADNLSVAHVSGDFLAVFGLAPRAGRAFSEEEQRAGHVALVGAQMVQRYFGGDTNLALRADLKIYGQLFRVVGVLPAGFDFPTKAEVWLPIDTTFPESTARSAQNYRAVGRLAPGVSLEQARLELSGVAAALAKQYPDTNTNKGAQVLPLQDYLVRNHRSTLWVMAGAVGLLLLIACANVANLMLARGADRTREVAVRLALGATRARLMSTMLAESAVLAVVAGLLGLELGWASIHLFVTFAPVDVPRLEQTQLDGRALLVATLASFATCFLAGLIPAIKSTRVDLNHALRTGGRGIAGSHGGMRHALAVLQLALSLVLLSGAGLLLRSFQRLLASDLGYRAENVLVMAANYPAVSEADNARAMAFFEDFSRRAAALPGVTRVAYAQNLPVDELGSNGFYDIEGRPLTGPNDGSRQNAIWRCVSADYFGTLGIPVVAGREFDARDAAAGSATVMINETLARTTWPNESPLGHRLKIGWDSEQPEWMTIVGVVRDTKQGSLDRSDGEELYVSVAQHPRLAPELKVIARTQTPPLTLAESFRRIAHDLNPEVPVKFTTAELLVSETLIAPRFRTLLLGLFAGLAFLLTTVGVAAVMACLVAERRAEIGVRMALGAQPGQVRRHFLFRALKLAGTGLAIGLVASFFTLKLLHSLLYGVSSADPLVLAAVCVALLLAATLAAWVPARRASKVDPLTVMRAE